MLRLSGGDQPGKTEEDGAPLSAQFVAWIAGSQRPLYAYIRSLMGPCGEADDVLQEVNLVLCRKAREYDGRGRFLTWACRVAYFEVLAHLKRRQRDKGLYFDEAVLEDLAGPLAREAEQFDGRLEALRHCLARLSPANRRMITARYARDGSVQAVALQLGRPAASVRVSLHRIRLALLECIEKTLSGKGNS